VLAVIEDEGVPILVVPFARIRMLVQMRSVEEHQTVAVAREMRRHPIEQHAQSGSVGAIDEITEVVGRAETRRRREVPDGLISPRAVEGMFHDRHELEMRVAHVLRIRHERVGEFAIGQPIRRIRFGR
jgi:hypothetical protein